MIGNFESSIIGAIIGAIIGSIITIISNYYFINLNKKHELIKVSKAFHSELVNYKQWLKYFIEHYSEKAYMGGDEESDGIPLMLDDINRPIFSQSSVFILFRKEMSTFNGELYGNLLLLYSYFMGAEEVRRKIKRIWVSNEASQNVLNLLNYQKEILRLFGLALDLLPKIEEELSKIHKENYNITSID